jgi:type II secretory pathway pseudopilin PulG
MSKHRNAWAQLPAAHSRPRHPGSRRLRCAGFTLIELGLVITIIAVLVGILLPVVHRVRLKGYAADTSNEISEISAAIERYDLDQHAYPGPLANDQICDPNFPNMDGGTNITGNLTMQAQSGSFGTNNYDGTGGTTWNSQITMSENLVLGLLGGLWFNSNNATSNNAYAISYDPTQVGLGPQSLANNGTTHRFPPYIETRNLDWTTNKNGITGRFADGVGPAASDGLGGCYDSPIPEFVDRYPSPLPILYLRAKPGASSFPSGTLTAVATAANPVITDDYLENNPIASGGPRCGVYDINQIAGYTRAPGTPPGAPTIIGAEKESINPYKAGTAGTWPNGSPKANTIPMQGLNIVTANPPAVLSPPTDPNYNYPYDAFPYFYNPNASAGAGTIGQAVIQNVAQARSQDGFILISAGEDRIYGTADDITSFGSVLPQ